MSPNNRHSLLLSEVTIGNLSLKNRIVMPATHLNYTPGGKVSDQLKAFYAQRAKGGAGLLIVGGCVISDVAGGPMMVSIMDDSDIRGLSELAQAVHEHKAKIGAQLYHAGAYSFRMLIPNQAITSSDHVSAFTREEAKGLSLEEIPEIQDQFAASAVRAQKAGFDMVEILGSAGYLICQFLSPKINQRQDQYGGSLENRMRFGLETVEKVRKAVGPDFCVGIRIAGHDFVPKSSTNEEAQIFAKACQEKGVDFINVTGGWHETKVPQLTSEVPQAGYSYLARAIKKAVSVPVGASNRIHTPQVAEEVLARGDSDLICMSRPLIADPMLPQKIAQNKTHLIKQCTSCNQGCFDSVLSLKPVICMVNPQAGYENKPELKKSPSPLNILVIGGGPAGCQTALTLAYKGHKVSLWEKAPSLGGQANWYHKPLHKDGFGEIGKWYFGLLTESGVEIKLNQTANLENISQFKPDQVILATGAESLMLPVKGIDLPHVLSAWDVLKGKVTVQSPAVVVGGGAVGLETALYLARKGALSADQLYFLTLFQAEQPENLGKLIGQGSLDVSVLEMTPKIGQGMGRSTKWIHLGLIKRFGVKVKTKAKVIAIEKDGLTAEIDGEKSFIPAKSVIMATGAQPVNNLEKPLKEKGFTVKVIGDANQPATVLKAISEAHKLGMAI